MIDGSIDVVWRLLALAERNGLGPSAPVMRNAAEEIQVLRTKVESLNQELERVRTERHFGVV